MHDLLIRGATVVDGLGHDPMRADVAVEGGRIAALHAFELPTTIPDDLSTDALIDALRRDKRALELNLVAALFTTFSARPAMSGRASTRSRG